MYELLVLVANGNCLGTGTNQFKIIHQSGNAQLRYIIFVSRSSAQRAHIKAALAQSTLVAGDHTELDKISSDEIILVV